MKLLLNENLSFRLVAQLEPAFLAACMSIQSASMRKSDSAVWKLRPQQQFHHCLEG